MENPFASWSYDDFVELIKSCYNKRILRDYKKAGITMEELVADRRRRINEVYVADPKETVTMDPDTYYLIRWAHLDDPDRFLYRTYYGDGQGPRYTKRFLRKPKRESACNTDEPKEHVLEAPRRRPMNDNSTDDFVAIDFETMTGLRTSACSVGMVKVIDGEIVQQFYSLINPVRDEHTDKEYNRRIHGIALETAEKAPTFAELFDGIRLFIGDLPLVCHNKSTDILIINQLMEYYGLSGIRTDNAICTYQLTGLSLSACCEKYNIPESNHHNALWDAEACARVYLELVGKPLTRTTGPTYNFSRKSDKAKEVQREHCVKLEDDAIKNKNTIFYNSRVVITGVFDAFPRRDDLAELLQSLGAKIGSSISSRTTHVVLGEGAGPKKMEKIQGLLQEGFRIEIVREPDLVRVLQQCTE